MENILTLIERTVSLYIFILMTLTFIRMFMSIIPSDSPSKFELFIFSATEPLVLPVRSILMRSETFQSIPVDFSLIITLIILSVVNMFV